MPAAGLEGKAGWDTDLDPPPRVFLASSGLGRCRSPEREENVQQARRAGSRSNRLCPVGWASGEENRQGRWEVLS